ncbi:hypothetical protein HXX76_005420 [Chlamydomonas incerta]|uniref:Blue (type 1) copper domain-containing protein n=1 Tax=Chlamydomonas incerta TaxID=51695 RepID=A0A835W3C8_CHLIN|nr:hypothetical protein HXX76_005420 [Chlamydomonas incerta]|eukprot:KAG2437800.1 hypothetical protein HXX76_005420 [Chlamydomonas incerta]
MGRASSNVLGRLLAAAAVSLALAAFAARAAPAPVMQTWGPNPAPLTVDVPCGAPLTLNWDTGSDLMHNVVSIPAADCSQEGQILAGTSNKGTWTTTFPRPGTYYYKCSETSTGGAAAPSRVVLSWAFYSAPKTVNVPCNGTLQLTWSGTTWHNVVQVPAADCALDGPVLAASAPAGNWSHTFTQNGALYYK